MSRLEFQGRPITDIPIGNLIHTLSTNIQIEPRQRQQILVGALADGTTNPHTVRNEYLHAARTTIRSPLVTHALLDTGLILLDFMPPRWTTLVGISETLRPVVLERHEPEDTLLEKLKGLEEAAIQAVVRQSAPTATLGTDSFSEDLTTAFVTATQQELKPAEVLILLQAGKIILPYLPHTDGVVTEPVATQLVTTLEPLVDEIAYALDFNQTRLAPYIRTFETFQAYLRGEPPPAPQPKITSHISTTVFGGAETTSSIPASQREPLGAPRTRKNPVKTTTKPVEKPAKREPEEIIHRGNRKERLEAMTIYIAETGNMAISAKELQTRFGISRAQAYKDRTELEKRGIITPMDPTKSRSEAPKRHAAILQYLAEHGYDYQTNPTVLEAAAAEFNVTKKTIYNAIHGVHLEGNLPEGIRIRPINTDDVIRYLFSPEHGRRLLDPTTQEAALANISRLVVEIRERAPTAATLLVTQTLEHLATNLEADEQQAIILLLTKVLEVDRPAPEDLRASFLEIVRRQDEEIDNSRIEAFISTGQILVPYLPLNQTTLLEMERTLIPVVRNISSPTEQDSLSAKLDGLKTNLIEAIVKHFDENVPANRQYPNSHSDKSNMLRQVLEDNDVDFAVVASDTGIKLDTVRHHFIELGNLGYLEKRGRKRIAAVTKRQAQILELLQQTPSLTEIGIRLGISTKAVSTEISRLRGKEHPIPPYHW